LHIKTDAGTLFGMLTQPRLVGIAVVEAGGQGVPALKIKEMREHFEDAPRGRMNLDPETKQAEDDNGYATVSHG